MKRKPKSRSALDPESVGAQVCARVARLLARLDFSPPPHFLERIRTFAATLATWGARTNLTARPGDPVEVAFHIVDSVMPLVIVNQTAAALLREAFAASTRALDLGSGAGFPALVLAAASATHFTLCESRRKRASFLSVAAAQMGLRNVAVEPSRVDASSFEADFDLVTTRALGPLSDFYKIAASALRPGGIAMLYAAATQRPHPEPARGVGLVSCAQLDYQLDRGDQLVRRRLAIWRKQ